jgi:hypothetical protein
VDALVPTLPEGRRSVAGVKPRTSPILAMLASLKRRLRVVAG